MAKTIFEDDEVRKSAEAFFEDIHCWSCWVIDNEPVKNYEEMSYDYGSDLLKDVMGDYYEDIFLTAEQKKIIYDVYLKYARAFLKKPKKMRDEIDEVLEKYGYATSDDIDLNKGVIYIEVK